MKFLNPLALWGLIAASIPIIIHLLNLRKRKTLKFSSLKFLKEIENSSIRKVKIKQWLLLILRTLTILFIALALSRPTLVNLSENSFASLEPKNAVIIIDNSISTLYDSNNGSIFNKEKKVTEDIISTLSNNDHIYIVTNDNTFDFVYSPENIESAKRKINKLEFSYLPFNFNSSLKRAFDIINSSEKYNNEIFVLSDSKFSGSKIDSVKTDKNIRLFYYDFNYSTNNTGIKEAKINSNILTGKRTIEVLVRVKNYSSKKISNKVLSAFVNKQRVTQKSFSLDGKSEKTIPIVVKLSNKKYNEVELKLEDDEFSQDNVYYLAVKYPNKINIGYIGNKIPNFLKSALDTSGTALLKIIPDNFDIADFNKLDLLILNSNKLSSNSFDKLKNTNKGILFIPPVNSSLNDINRITKSLFNVKTLSIESFSPYYNLKLRKKESVLAQNIFRNTNVTENLDIKVYKSYIYSSELAIPQILTGKDIPFIALVNDKSKSVLFASPFNLEWTDFYLSGLFPVILNKSFLFLSSTNISGIDFKLGENVSLKPFIENIPVIIDFPDGKKLNISSTLGKDYVVKRFNLPGIYKVIKDNSIIDIFSINNNPNEFSGNFRFDKVKSQLKNKNVQMFYLSNQDDFINIINNSRFGFELWKILLFLAILMLIAEMIISKGSTKGRF